MNKIEAFKLFLSNPDLAKLCSNAEKIADSHNIISNALDTTKAVKDLLKLVQENISITLKRPDDVKKLMQGQDLLKGLYEIEAVYIDLLDDDE